MEHSRNYQKVKDYYDKGYWNKQKVRNAVTNPTSTPWITPEEYQEITGETYYE
jgi:hypothetical protein